MRKCMFMSVPPQLRDMRPPVSPAAMLPALMPPTPPRVHVEAPVVPHPHNPKRDVKMFPAYGGDDLIARKRADLYAAEKAKLFHDTAMRVYRLAG